MSDYEFDLFVIGVGSGGVRAARMSAERACDQRRRPDPDTLGAKWGFFGAGCDTKVTLVPIGLLVHLAEPRRSN